MGGHPLRLLRSASPYASRRGQTSPCVSLRSASLTLREGDGIPLRLASLAASLFASRKGTDISLCLLRSASPYAPRRGQASPCVSLRSASPYASRRGQTSPCVPLRLPRPLTLREGDRHLPALASLRVPLRFAKGTGIPLRLASLAASHFASRKGGGWLELVAVFVVGEA